jgi:hypothetical protein
VSEWEKQQPSLSRTLSFKLSRYKCGSSRLLIRWPAGGGSGGIGIGFGACLFPSRVTDCLICVFWLLFLFLFFFQFDASFQILLDSGFSLKKNLFFLRMFVLFGCNIIIIIHSGVAISKWGNAWNDILTSGGAKRSTRWIITDIKVKRLALNHITQHVVTARTTNSSPSSFAPKEDAINNETGAETRMTTTTTKSAPLNILCPLAGNDMFVHYAWTQGHSVTAIDLMPQAITELRQLFGGVNDDDTDADWTKVDFVGTTTNSESKDPNGGIVCCWTHKSGRATLFQGDITTPIPELHETFDAIYDKDSFGAIPPSIRSAFCTRMSDYVKVGGILYSEVKFKCDDNPSRFTGPPHHLEKDDFMKEEHFGSTFDYIAHLGEVYDFQTPGAQQMGHVLQKKRCAMSYN